MRSPLGGSLRRYNALRPKFGQPVHGRYPVKTCQGVRGAPNFEPVGKPEREHTRYAHEAAITLHEGGRVHHGRTTNVSRGGLCADLAATIPLGTEVEVDMQLVFEEDEKSDALRLSAHVVWCTTVDEGYQIGLAFRPLTADKTKLINLFLRYLDDGSQPIASPKGERSIDDQFR